MSLELKLPDIRTLNPKQPDYVSKIDDGIEIIRAARLELENYQKGRKDIVEFLREKGIHINVNSTTIKSEGNIRKTTNIGIQINSEEEIKKIEELTHEFYKEKIETEKQNMRLEDANNNYFHAAIDLTKTQKLNESKFDCSLFQFYFANPEGVYELRTDLRNPNDTKVIKNELLNPALFSDEKYVLDFKNKSKDAKANAYLFTNPSRKMNPEIIIVYKAEGEILKFVEASIKEDLEKVAPLVADLQKCFIRARSSINN